MAETETTTPSPDTASSETARRPSFITPEMIEKNPVLAAIGLFAVDPYFDELVAEIKKERARQRRRLSCATADAAVSLSRRVGRPDCQIAAIALANNLTVVTSNTRHFAQIPGVVYEDWTRTKIE